MTPLDTVYQAIGTSIDDHHQRFVGIAREIWRDPELGFEEHRAMARLTAPLEEAGFTLERGVAGLDTAFRASWRGSEDGPTVAILSEYDALKGLGHACGHNLIGTGGVLAGWALARAWPDLPGRLQVIGTPAEEGGGGKTLMVDRGVFAGVDAALMFHPNTGPSMVHRGALASQRLRVRFGGRPAHASASPWDGVNALDAMIQLFVAVGLLRQQLRDDARIHGVITHGGDAANVIPERTEAEFLVRAEALEYQREVKARVETLARSAAIATGCSVDLDDGPLYANRVNNMTMARTMQAHLEQLGEVVVEPDPREGVGSSDIGNVSLVCPTIHPYVAISREPAPGHSAAFRAAADSDFGYRQMLKAAAALARTAADLFGREGLLERARLEHRQAV